MIPPPPAADAVLFRSSSRRALLAGSVLAVAFWLAYMVIFVGLPVLNGESITRALALSAPIVMPQVAVLCLVAVGLSVIALARQPCWVRLSAAGVEIAGTGRRSVLIPWSGVESATVRGRSVFAVLGVIPRAEAMVSLHNGPGRFPRPGMRGGRPEHAVWVGAFRGGAAGVLAAIRARGVPEPNPPA